MAGVELEDKLPEHEYRDLFKPEDRLHISVSYEHENLNTQEYLDSLQQKLFNNLSRCGNSVQSWNKMTHFPFSCYNAVRW